MEEFYTVPSWAGKPVAGLHLDVTKEGKLIQKLMIDEKKCYLFGRNPDLNDFCVDHSSCSRVHAALVFHKHLQRIFLVDLNSTHGTFVGSIKLEGHKPTQIPVDTSFRFGASTRVYTLREKPIQVQANRSTDAESKCEETDQSCVLPDDQSELDNLTEFNTAHNKRISMLRINDGDLRRTKKRSKSVAFKDEEEIINPEDVDPTIGKFRNLVQTTIIPKKKFKMDSNISNNFKSKLTSNDNLMDVQPSCSNQSSSVRSYSLATSMLLGNFQIPNPAPDIDLERHEEIKPSLSVSINAGPSVQIDYNVDSSREDFKKKKYAKESWPGRKSSSMSM